MILISHKDGKFWPRHENGEWFSDAEREAWHQENVDRNEKIAAQVFEDIILAGSGRARL